MRKSWTSLSPGGESFPRLGLVTCICQNGAFCHKQVCNYFQLITPKPAGRGFSAGAAREAKCVWMWGEHAVASVWSPNQARNFNETIKSQSSTAPSFLRRLQATTIQLKQTAWRTAARVPGTARLRQSQTSCLTGHAPGRPRRARTVTRFIMEPAAGRSHPHRGGNRWFPACTLERLTDLLEYNASSGCQAFMVMLHSQAEWWISPVMELDPIHRRPAAGRASGPEEPQRNDDAARLFMVIYGFLVCN